MWFLDSAWLAKEGCIRELFQSWHLRLTRSVPLVRLVGYAPPPGPLQYLDHASAFVGRHLALIVAVDAAVVAGGAVNDLVALGRGRHTTKSVFL